MSSKHPTFEQALLKVEAKFISNLPECELNDPKRLFFHIEQAWWFYDDNYNDTYKHLPRYGALRGFAQVLFGHCDLLQPMIPRFEEMLQGFKNYRAKIPTCGCIMLNPQLTKIVLVCSWKGTSWSFPKGKINQGEDALDCAVREVVEETGYDCSQFCREEDVLDIIDQGKLMRLFIAPGVPEDTYFEPQTQKEVSKVQFHPVDNLPKKHYGVLPFISRLKQWISKNQQRRTKGKSKNGTCTGSKQDVGTVNNHTNPAADLVRVQDRGSEIEVTSTTPFSAGFRVDKNRIMACVNASLMKNLL
jgi:mRNA-decapping enzyme subunit 2